MEIREMLLEKDIPVFYVQAVSFPNGIMGAYTSLHSSLGDAHERPSYGVTEMVDDHLTYKACAGLFTQDEKDEIDLPVYNIPAGRYLSMKIKPFGPQMQKFPEFFKELMDHPMAKPGTLGIEHYKTLDTVILMVQVR
ncbi:hypothetical protein [Chitinophaga barathri]|uniref:AraC family transcriptional regulator n=1 Tax=Chitinophaga barathri TaxID=1647451 RepID=A0A3N4MED4_9BACT|nr:hypothetical protein [Chitinophaga barathri]RPD42274.1 hypothetical protein EG028_03600 [Chitinophaga barathri]